MSGMGATRPARSVRGGARSGARQALPALSRSRNRWSDPRRDG